MRYQGVRIPLATINVLTQPRQTFEEIETLAEDIASKNLLHPLTVACFNKDSCQQYLDTINLLWGTNYESKKLVMVPKGKETFYVLLAGERRLRACRYLQEIACESCKEEFGPEGCYKRHFGDEKVDVRLCINVPAMDALFIQASENIHMRVPPHQEARFYYLLFCFLKEKDSNYPLSRFARQVGRSPEKIREAIKFCILPAKIREFVEEGQIPYGIACEIARLQNGVAQLTEKELEWWTVRAIISNYKVPEFREIVTNFLRERCSGQTSLFDIFTEEQKKQLESPHFRLVVERQIIMAIWSWIHYFVKILNLFEQGKLGEKDSPFSEGSPVKVFRKLIDKEKQLLPYLQNFLPPKKFQESRETLLKAGVLLSRLEENSPHLRV